MTVYKQLIVYATAPLMDKMNPFAQTKFISKIKNKYVMYCMKKKITQVLEKKFIDKK